MRNNEKDQNPGKDLESLLQKIHDERYSGSRNTRSNTGQNNGNKRMTQNQLKERS